MHKQTLLGTILMWLLSALVQTLLLLQLDTTAKLLLHIKAAGRLHQLCPVLDVILQLLYWNPSSLASTFQKPFDSGVVNRAQQKHLSQLYCTFLFYYWLNTIACFQHVSLGQVPMSTCITYSIHVSFFQENLVIEPELLV